MELQKWMGSFGSSVRVPALAIAAVATLALALGTAPSAAAACPNEAIRLEQHATWLPDCRAFELVTPGADKNGNALMLIGVLTAGDGERVAYYLYNSLPEGRTTLGGYVAGRSAEGWKTKYVTGTDAPNPAVFGNYFPEFLGASMNLERLFLDTEGNPEGVDPYVRGAWATNPDGDVELIAPDIENGSAHVRASSQDGSHLIIGTEGGVSYGPVPGGPIEPHAKLLYEYVGGQLHLVNVDNSGDVISPAGAVMPAGLGSPNAAHTVSADGSRVLFESQPPPGTSPNYMFAQLYMRIDGERTVMVSEPRTSGPHTYENGVAYAGASADDTEVFFTTSAKLTEGITGEGPYLYEYSLPIGAGSGSLTQISDHPVATGGGTTQVLASDDGSHVYYLSSDDGGSLWLYHVSGAEAGKTEKVAGGLGETAPSETPPVADTRLTETASGAPMNPAELSPNGEHLVFTSDAQLAGSTQTGVQLYKFDDEPGSGGRLTLISTGPSAPSTRFNSELLGGGTNPASGTFSGYQSDGIFESEAVYLLNSGARSLRQFGSWWDSMSSDGNTVFFETAAALVPQDVNGKGDVYEWHDGKVSLISSGKSDTNSYFAGASRDGSTVFFYTREDLIPSQDGDGQVDIYAARVDGGFPGSSAPSCEGEGCQGAAATPPATAPIGSAVTRGPGNPKPKGHKPCARRGRHRGCKAHKTPKRSRCTRKHNRGKWGKVCRAAKARTTEHVNPQKGE